jgi:DNA-binding MarR family transcriptional regulator
LLKPYFDKMLSMSDRSAYLQKTCEGYSGHVSDPQLKKMLADHHNLSIAQWRVLGQLATNSPATVRGIAATTYMAKSQISRAAACLVRAGYAVRGKDVDDERSAVFKVTKGGQKKYKTVMRMNREPAPASSAARSN